jgi:hypothetical protein
MKKQVRYLLAIALVLGFTAPVGAQEKGPNDWKYGIAIYLWGTGIEGTSQIGAATAPVDITFSDALDNLSSALMLHFEAQKNQWGFLVDFMHVGLDPEASLPNGASLTLDTTNNIFDVAGLYQATDNFQVLLGLRFTEFELEGIVPGVASRTIADESWTDGFVGGRLLVPFGSNEKWRFRARADVGAGDSDLVWNAVLGIDYRFSNRVAGLLGYRWLDYDYDNGKSGADRFGYDVTYEGPAAAVVFNW